MHFGKVGLPSKKRMRMDNTVKWIAVEKLVSKRPYG